MRFLLLLAVMPLWAADDADAILRRFVDAQNRNDEKARQYTYLEDAVWYVRDQAGELHQGRSETNEVIFVEGLRYKKLIARNGQPLNAKEQAKIARDMRETAEQRRRHRAAAPGGKILSGHATADLGSLEELLTLFDNRVAGEEDIEGRKTWVIQSKPPAGRVPATEHEKEVLSFEKKFWIDQSENIMLRAVYSVTGNHIFAKPGSVLSINYRNVNREVWQPSLFVLDVLRGKTTAADAPRTEYRYSRFQKFNVQSTITLDPPK